MAVCSPKKKEEKEKRRRSRGTSRDQEPQIMRLLLKSRLISRGPVLGPLVYSAHADLMAFTVASNFLLAAVLGQELGCSWG